MFQTDFDEAAYIRANYGTCPIWPCPCQVEAVRRRIDPMALKHRCPNWQPCADRFWAAMLERLRAGA